MKNEAEKPEKHSQPSNHSSCCCLVYSSYSSCSYSYSSCCCLFCLACLLWVALTVGFDCWFVLLCSALMPGVSLFWLPRISPANLGAVVVWVVPGLVGGVCFPLCVSTCVSSWCVFPKVCP